jgi:uncharacterized protein involved in exopolysaccharide biosynthesis
VSERGSGPSDGSVSRRDIVVVLFRHKFRMLAVLLLSTSVAALYLALADDVYEANAKILVKLGREKATEVDAYSRGATNFLFQERTQNINNEIEILRSGALVRRTALALMADLSQPAPADEPASWLPRFKARLKAAARYAGERVEQVQYWIGLRKRLSEEERFLERVADALHVENVEDTDVIQISFRWSDPSAALLALEAHVSEYFSRHLEIHGTEKSQEFYGGEISVQERKLRAAEDELAKFTRSVGIANLTVQKEVVIRDVAELERNRSDAVARLDALAVQIANLKRTYETTGEWLETQIARGEGRDIRDLNALDDSFFKLMRERSQLVESAASQAIDHQLAKLRKQKFDSLMSIVQAERAAEESRKASYERILAAKRRLLAEYSASTVPLEQLQRARELQTNDYLFFRKKAEEFNVFKDLNRKGIASIKVIDPAQKPLVPKYPKKRIVLGLAVLIGVLLAILYALVSEFFDHTFKNEADVARVLGLPLLASVPELAGADLRSPRRRSAR